MAKYVLIKQMNRKPFTVVVAVEFEVRQDARDEAKRLNRTAVNYKYKVLPLKVGKIRRSVPSPPPMPVPFP